jgi:F-type H+-transporting ATPase subunit alpha
MLERGRRVREVFQQPQYKPLPVPEQVAGLLAASEGLLNAIPVEMVAEAERAIRRAVTADLPAVCERMTTGARLTAEDRQDLLRVVRNTLASTKENHR